MVTYILIFYDILLYQNLNQLDAFQGAHLSYEIKLHGHALGRWTLDDFEASLSLNALRIIGLET